MAISPSRRRGGGNDRPVTRSGSAHQGRAAGKWPATINPAQEVAGQRAGAGGNHGREDTVPQRPRRTRSGVSESSRAAATGVPNIAPIMPAVPSPIHICAPTRQQTRAERVHHADGDADDRVFGAEAHTAREHENQGQQQAGQDNKVSGVSTSPSVADTGAGVARSFHATSPTATPVRSG